MTRGCLSVADSVPVVLIVDEDGSVRESLLALIAEVGEQAALPIILITGNGDIPTAVRAMQTGAVEFLTEPLTYEALSRAIEEALERRRRRPDAETLVEALRVRHQSLSRREREVMALVVHGRLNKQIGSLLGISEITVKAHRGRVMRKMGATSLAELVRMAARLELV